MVHFPRSCPNAAAMSRARAGWERPAKIEMGKSAFVGRMQSAMTSLAAHGERQQKNAPGGAETYQMNTRACTVGLPHTHACCPGRIRTSTYGSKGRCPAIRRPGTTSYPSATGSHRLDKIAHLTSGINALATILFSVPLRTTTTRHAYRALRNACAGSSYVKYLHMAHFGSASLEPASITGIDWATGSKRIHH